MPAADDVLAALDPEQQQVVRAVRGPVCVLAGAGTGKTRAITHRIAYAVHTGAVAPGHVLAVTFTARAAGELRARLHTLGVGGVQALTFHAAARRQLAHFWPRVAGAPLPRIADTKAPLLAEAAARCRVDADRVELRDLAGEVEWAKVTETAPDRYAAAAGAAGRTPPRDPATVARVYAAYEEVKAQRGLVDFEDVLLLAVGLLADRTDVVAEVRDRYRWFTVDEYQDVNPLQQRLLDLWRGDREDVCVVGDPGQTIYTFTGATPDFLLDFPRRHPGAVVVRLVRDYRSTPQVVDLANRVLAGGGPPAPGRPAPLELLAQRPPGPAPVLQEYPDEPAEAAGVAARVRGLLAAGTPASEVAVLFRTNGQSQLVEQALGEAGVPYLVRGGERFFDRPEVRQALLLLRGGVRTPADGVPLPEQVAAALSGAGWRPAPPAGSGAVRERWESLAALVRLAEELAAATPGLGLRELVAELDQRAAAQHPPTVQGVTLASLHAAKGLEWDAVFLVGLVEGFLPISYAQTPEQVAEERRLLYVGVTRARQRLFLSWSAARSPGGRAGRRPSRFLDELLAGRPGPRGRAATPRGAAGPAPARCRVCGGPLLGAVARKLGRCPGCPASVDEALLDRLRVWRLAEAREQGVPAYCVFTDATLQAIAEGRPTDPAALARVPGVGRVKLDRYAAAVLGLVAAAPPGGPADEAGEAAVR